MSTKKPPVPRKPRAPRKPKQATTPVAPIAQPRVVRPVSDPIPHPALIRTRHMHDRDGGFAKDEADGERYDTLEEKYDYDLPERLK